MYTHGSRFRLLDSSGRAIISIEWHGLGPVLRIDGHAMVSIELMDMLYSYSCPLQIVTTCPLISYMICI